MLLTQKGIHRFEVKGRGVFRRDGFWPSTDGYTEVHEKRESRFDWAASAIIALREDVCREFVSAPQLSYVLPGFKVMYPNILLEYAGTEADSRTDLQRGLRPSLGGVVGGTRNSTGCCSISAPKGLENDFITLAHTRDLESECCRSVINVAEWTGRVGMHQSLHKLPCTSDRNRLRRWLDQRARDTATAV